MVGGTVRNAASSLATALRNNHQPSPLHHQGGTNLRPVFRALLRAYDNQDPAPNRQKAITPRLLCALFESSGADTVALMDSAPSVAADLVLGSFFFACRACEYTKTKTPGKTQVIALGGVIFRSKTKQTLSHDNPDLVWVYKVDNWSQSEDCALRGDEIISHAVMETENQYFFDERENLFFY